MFFKIEMLKIKADRPGRSRGNPAEGSEVETRLPSFRTLLPSLLVSCKSTGYRSGK